MKRKHGDSDSADRDLGLDLPITRRDFLDATLLAAGSGLLRAPAPIGQGTPGGNPAWDGFGGVGDYARSHGNMWSSIAAAHDLRDGKFGGSAAGRQAIDTTERYDLVVVGGGLSGLGAAHFFHKQRGGRCLILDNHAMVGGEAKRNEFLVDGVQLIGPQGSNDFGIRRIQGWAGDYWNEIGLPSGPGAFEHQAWAPGVTPLEMARDHYYFQLWADQFASHGFFFKDPDGNLLSLSEIAS